MAILRLVFQNHCLTIMFLLFTGPWAHHEVSRRSSEEWRSHKAENSSSGMRFSTYRPFPSSDDARLRFSLVYTGLVAVQRESGKRYKPWESGLNIRRIIIPNGRKNRCLNFSEYRDFKGNSCDNLVLKSMPFPRILFQNGCNPPRKLIAT